MVSTTNVRQIGGSLAVIIPKEVAEKEKIHKGDKVSISLRRIDEMQGLWGKLSWVSKPTQKIMEEIDEGEND
ncbi:AbrB/MazE/SpoVT family DNA-binding domain-containing protein [Candidatus Woesearchaeota archaeon]|nr:AbrB/MazE/SpoVT family DNA-binding domain-containing protein [Candidatus Woesearchaeota archaeon]